MTPSLTTPAPVASEPASASLFAPIAQLLRDLREVVLSLSDDEYRSASPRGMSGTIGGHVRHTLDHIASLLAARGSHQLNYDARERGTDVELNRASALQAAERLADRCCSSEGQVEADEPMTLLALTCADQPAVAVQTTFAREIVFVVSHTVHHHAMIAAIVREMGKAVPARFGYAPATIAYQEARPCAR